MTFPAYSKYRDSGLEWLGEVPAHWTVLPIRMVARLESGHTPSRSRPDWWRDCTIPWFTLADVGQIREQRRKVIYQTQELVSELGLANSSARLLPSGTVMLSRTASVGFSAIMGVDMATTQDFANWICGPRLNNEFLLFVFKAMIGEFERLRYGSTHNTIYMPDIAAFRLALPPLDEQQAIVDFLDRETAKIDTLVEEQQRLIALLKEKRKAVISHAVTRGLKPGVPMKDSGIEWLGEMPAHWRVAPMRSLFRFVKRQNGDDLEVLSVYRDYGVIRKSDRSDNNNKTPEDLSSYQTVQIDDLVINKMKAWQGSLGISQICGITSPDYAVLAPEHEEDGEFLNFLLRCQLLPQVYRAISNGIRLDQWRLELEKLKEVKIPIPPKDEQGVIKSSIKNAVDALETLEKLAEGSIQLLLERRSVLISDAVTGKIDVRGSAQVVPFPVGRARARGLIAAEIIERSVRQATFGRVKLQKIAYLAEAHVGVSELEGTYLREAAGPLDRDMVREMEREVRSIAGILADQQGGTGTAVSYRLGDQRGAHRAELSALLGADRSATLDKLIGDIATIDTKGAEAVATLYAVWNDALIEGETPTDTENVLAVLTEWHPEKKEKFRMDELHTWLGWMRRHGLMPRGTGPKTATGRLFA